MALIQTRIIDGVWEGLLSGSTMEPRLISSFNGMEIPVTWEAESANDYKVRIELPRSMLTIGKHVVSIQHQDTGEQMSQFMISVGEDSLNPHEAKIEHLRAELDLLKSAFRQFARDVEDFQRIMVEQIEGDTSI